ncbi:DUF202 domain-containing protein [Microbacterium elymi]|uniref:DUF202 domain-containing protein n=1 Tax=Microbacterium elymi TaxID=2909587 RepID=A0ABY5NKS8_9MICO|nr:MULTISPECIES: DUF202 domain-containing protein [Microbacterium]UUT35788.1 DUF202 domain-containing protein [Microbacterium elymi]
MTDAAHERPFDPGLQTERTLLAWRRTCLALVVGNAVAIKYLIDALGGWAALLGVAGIALAGIAWVLCTVRYRRVHLGLVRDQTLVSGGRLPALVAAAVAVICVAALILLFTLWRPW